MACKQLQYCVIVVVVLQATVANGLRLDSGVTCQLPAPIPDNHYYCYKMSIFQETVGHREVETEVLQLVQPCPSCFPEVQSVKRVWQVAITEDRCSVSPLWRRPRTIKQTAPGTRILTTHGLLRGNKYPNNILCVWNVSCEAAEVLYFNVSQQAIHVPESVENPNGGNHSCSDYIQVTAAGNTSEVSCGEEPHPQVVDRIQYDGHIEVVFRADESGNGNGVEIDTACFPLDVQPLQEYEESSSMDQLLGAICVDSENSTSAQHDFLADLFRLHYRLLSVTDACARGVTKCVNANFLTLSAYLRKTMDRVMEFESVCNPLLRTIIDHTTQFFFK